MKKRYLITGGAGIIGSAITKKLVRRGGEIRVLDNEFRGSKDRLKDIKKDFEFIRGDIRDFRVVEKACKGVDIVLHLAFINGTEFFYTKPDLVLGVGVKGIVNIIDACIKNNIGNLIVASSSEVYQTPPVVPTPETVPMVIPDPLNPRYSYAGGKIISELMAINFGRKYFKRVIIFRPHNVYGPDMGQEHVIPQFILRMKGLMEQNPDQKVLEFPIQGTGRETRSFCFIDDFTDGLELVLDKGENLEIYNIGATDEIAITEVAKKIGTILGRKVKIIPGELQKGGTPRRSPDISKLKKLGYEPKVSLDEGLKPTVSWYIQNAHFSNTSNSKSS